jgi:hypothetical protein
MGIYCNIYVVQPPNNTFTPGSSVCGSINYTFDEATKVKRINVSLVGKGKLGVTKTTGHGQDRKRTHYGRREEYVNVGSDILLDKEGKEIAVGTYETLFNFKLPENIPSSLKYAKNDTDYDIDCKIVYCVKIKFEFPNLFKFKRSFQSEIKVLSGIAPKCSTGPLIYGERKKLFQIFGKKDSTLILKAWIQNSIIEPNGKVKLNYELVNNTNKTVKGVETKIVEVFNFHTHENSEIKRYVDIDFTYSMTCSIKGGETFGLPIVIDTPPGLVNLDHSRIMSRGYEVLITVILPMPHTNMVLHIPIQVGDVDVKPFNAEVSSITNESPPTYWEAMNECVNKGDASKI